MALPVSLDASVDTERRARRDGARQEADREGLGFVLLDEPGEPRWGQQVEPDRVRAVVEELK